MGTKTNPGAFDCYENALPDEPMFVLLGRDPDFYYLVFEWAQRRRRAIEAGERPQTDIQKVWEAEMCALQGRLWRDHNDGKWRRSKSE